MHIPHTATSTLTIHRACCFFFFIPSQPLLEAGWLCYPFTDANRSQWLFCAPLFLRATYTGHCVWWSPFSTPIGSRLVMCVFQSELINFSECAHPHLRCLKPVKSCYLSIVLPGKSSHLYILHNFTCKRVLRIVQFALGLTVADSDNGLSWLIFWFEWTSWQITTINSIPWSKHSLWARNNSRGGGKGSGSKTDKIHMSGGEAGWDTSCRLGVLWCRKKKP